MSMISDAIQKHHELQTQQFKSYQQDPTERQAYLAYCQKEAKRIFDSLVKEILDDIVRYGKAFVNVVGKYDNIFKYRISKIIKEMFKREGLEIHLSDSIGIAEINII